MSSSRSHSELYGWHWDRPATLRDLRWLVAHGALGIVDVEDVEDLRRGVDAVWNLMKDGAWRTRPEIESALPFALESMRRMRDLRAELETVGWTVARRRRSGRIFEYRIEERKTTTN